MLALSKTSEGAYSWATCDNHYQLTNAVQVRDLCTFSLIVREGGLIGETKIQMQELEPKVHGGLYMSGWGA